jgi:hypothetical protein
METAFPFGRNHLSSQKSVQKRREKIEVFFLTNLLLTQVASSMS